MFERQGYNAGSGPFPHHVVQAPVLHGRIEGFLHLAVQAVDFIDEQDIRMRQVDQDGRQLATVLDGGPGSDGEPTVHLAGQDLAEGGLAQPRGPVQQDMVQRLAALAGCLDQDFHVVLQVILADQLVQALRPQGRIPVVPRLAVARYQALGSLLPGALGGDLAALAGHGGTGSVRTRTG